MSAHLLATLVWVLSSAPCFGWADLVNPPKRPVVVYLKTNAGQPSVPMADMKREASALLETAGYDLDWRDVPHGPSEAVEAPIVVFEFRGICQPARNPEDVIPLTGEYGLASTAVSDGQVLPFGTLQCDALTRMITSALSKTRVKQDFLYGRAMGRLVAHELYHILTKTRDHDDGGVGKSHFSANDVLAEHFEFDTPSLAKLREPAGVGPEITEDALEESGR